MHCGSCFPLALVHFPFDHRRHHRRRSDHFPPSLPIPVSSRGIDGRGALDTAREWSPRRPEGGKDLFRRTDGRGRETEETTRRPRNRPCRPVSRVSFSMSAAARCPRQWVGRSVDRPLHPPPPSSILALKMPLSSRSLPRQIREGEADRSSRGIGQPRSPVFPRGPGVTKKPALPPLGPVSLSSSRVVCLSR